MKRCWRACWVWCCVAGVFGQWQLDGLYQVEPGYLYDEEERYFEQLFELQLRRGPWSAGFAYEEFNPAKPQSLMDEDEGIWQRFISYQSDRVTVRAGTFHTLLGRGLVLKAYQAPDVGLDRRLDGLLVEYRSRFLELRGLTGDLYGLDRESHQPVHAGEASFKPFQGFRIGGTFLDSETRFVSELEVSSAFMEWSGSLGAFFGEYAFTELSNQHAFYGSVDVFAGPVSVNAEYKDYQESDLNDGAVIFNDPPTLVTEHRFTLWNRHLYALSAFDERGWSIKMQTPVTDSGFLTLHHARTQTHETEFSDSLDLFEESYAIGEWTGSGWESHLILGIQRDTGYEYQNFGLEWRWTVWKFPLGLVAETQRAKAQFFDDQNHSQALAVDLTLGPRQVLSMVAEHSTSDESDRHDWVGFRYGLTVNSRFEMDVFVGSRRKGKICAGGICVYSPEFEGIELNGRYRFNRAW